MATTTMQLIQKQTVGAAGASSVTFSNIPQTFTDLKLVVSGRSDYAAQYNFCALTFNASATGYSQRYLAGTGASASSGTGYTDKIRIDAPAASNTASTFGSIEIYIPNYTSSNNKSVSVDWVYESNSSTNNYLEFDAALWSNSAAITSITYANLNSAKWAQYSTFSLYGISSSQTQNTLTPKASGGDIIVNDGTYWYHAFINSGTFTPKSGFGVDVLCVAGGGGGGGFYHAPGGGAGGLLYTANNSLSVSSTYAVTVGSGGTGGNSTTFTSGTQGGASSFIGTGVSLSATGGGAGPATGVGNAGGSGSGGGANDSAGGAGTSGQGNAGGAAYSTSPNQKGGGGGGAGSAGTSGSTTGNGGAGVNTYSSWATATGTGVSGYYAGGGAGSGQTTAGGTGGAGGGGNGGTSNTAAATSGTANTGGGGGGGSNNGSAASGPGGNGGSGVVIIRYTVA